LRGRWKKEKNRAGPEGLNRDKGSGDGARENEKNKDEEGIIGGRKGGMKGEKRKELVGGVGG